MNDKLTTQEYWEKYYAHNHADKQHIINVCSYYDKFWEVLLNNKPKNKTIIEIGGFPGRYLAYLASKFELHPTCLDYNSDTSQIEKSFEVMGIDKYSIQIEDFTTFIPKEKYDYLMSNGFIEHFDDFNSILDKHVAFLKPGGRMLIMIPNKRFLRKIYGLLCDYENLKAHNLKTMNLKVFKNFAKRHDLNIISNGYYGGFPYAVHQKLNWFQNIIYKIFRIIFKAINPYLLKHPSKYFSAAIIAIIEKPDYKTY